MDYIYGALLESDPDGGFVVTFPDVPAANTHGENRAEALTNAAEALGLALRGYLQQGKELPQAVTNTTDAVAVPADDAMKLALVQAFNAAGISKTELARRLGKDEVEARRILNPDHPTKFPAMQAALAVLGKTIVVSVRDAA
ncbi:HicB family protein [Phyllobacterium phragmitis]|uniref:HicB family protein n=1 Tax=Phyllobacterium phragmitis TaxID=2670329 RepID=A0A2S9IZH5_9HYPH|nr:type II toxin-antitoxin system HicB family antitoxin [Phyllobacterium phragmitis]PRD45932.1 HicB family protein [Phyllobacterium phragmitis]